MVPIRLVRGDAHTEERAMKIKTNLRAGSGGASGSGHNHEPEVQVQSVYVPPVGRCVGY